MAKKTDNSKPAIKKPRALLAAIVGGGKGCESILKMVDEDRLGRFRMKIVGVADLDQNSRGSQRARELGIALVTTDYRELYEITGLDLIIELIGNDAIRDEIERTRPRHVKLIDHFAARLFWELHQAEDSIIKQRTLMRERVEVERERIAQILNSIPDEIVVVDRDMIIQDANSSFLRNNQLELGDVVGSLCYDMDQSIRGDCQVAVGNCPFNTVMKDGQPVSLVRKHFAADGRALYAAIVGAPWLDKDGQVIGMIEMTRDITHRIRLEEQLAASEVQLQQLMELAPIATYVKNRSGHYIDVNPAACALFGKPKKEILGKTDMEIFPREAAEVLRVGDRRAWHRKDAISFDTEIHLGERLIYLSTVKFPILDENGKPSALCGLSTDVSAQKLAEAKLTETRTYIQQVLDNSPVIIVTTDMEGKVVSFNRGAEATLGYKMSEVVGKPASMFYREESERTGLLEKVMTGDAVRDYTTELVKKDGSAVVVSLTLSQLTDQQGKIIGTVGMSKDISHRKSLMNQLLQSERMAAVGRLASGVAHEINNPLAVISEIAGYLDDLVNGDLTVGQSELDQELREGLPKILNQVKRGRTITHRLLSFGRKSEARVREVDVNASLEEILPFLEKEALLAEVSIHLDFDQGLSKVAVEEMQLQEIFINLITNAIHALADQKGGNIWLSTSQEGAKVFVEIRDDGPGIAEEVRHRLFDPFVTTKPTGQGTGLGLSICYGIVKRYDGEIRVKSELGQGATFTVILPAHKPSLSLPPEG